MWSKTLLLAVVLTVAVVPVTSLLAQEVEEKDKDEVGGGGKVITLKEIVVTGEWVRRPLSETTTSVTLLPEASLQRNDARRVYDAVRHVPNLTPAPPDFLPAIRGVQGDGPQGLEGAPISAAPPRAKLIVDDVSRIQAYSNNAYQFMFDVEQVEVLRGPQATTRGPNSIAGIFAVNTKDPVFVSEGAAQAWVDWNEVSDFGYRSNAMVNVPFGNETAMRFVLQYEKDRIPTQIFDDKGTAPPGTDFDAQSEYNTLNLRNKLLWVPQSLPDFSALFTLEYQTARDVAFDSLIGETDPENRRRGFSDGQRIFDTEDYSFISDLRYDVGDTGEFRSLTSYMKNEFHGTSDSNSAPRRVIFAPGLERELLAQDFLYNFKNVGSFDGIVGASFRRETGITRTGGFPIDSEDERESLSAFADLTYHLSDEFRFLGGGRLMKNTVIFTGRVGIPVNVDQDVTVFLPKAGLAYDLDARQTIYGTARRGFNPGGGGPDFATFEFYEFDPEYVWTYELGYRGNFMDNGVSFNATVFYNQYDDYQFYYETDFAQRMFNYDGDSYGAELEVRAQATDSLELIGGVGLLKTQIDDSGAEPYDGNRFGKDPEVTLNTGVVWQMTPRTSADVAATYVGKYFGTFAQASGTESGDYVNVDIGMTGDINGFRVRGFVRNVFDELQYYEKLNSMMDRGGYVLPPREIGITVTYAF